MCKLWGSFSSSSTGPCTGTFMKRINFPTRIWIILSSESTKKVGKCLYTISYIETYCIFYPLKSSNVSGRVHSLQMLWQPNLKRYLQRIYGSGEPCYRFFINVDLNTNILSLTLKEIFFHMTVIQVIPFLPMVVGLTDNYMDDGSSSDAEENIIPKHIYSSD